MAANMDDDKIDQIIRLLNEATTILTKELPMPDVEVPNGTRLLLGARSLGLQKLLNF
jgi:hypothetical protein